MRLADSGAVIVDARSTSNVPSIHAVGDVTDRIQLTPVAIREGHWLADRLFGGATREVNYDAIATAVFTTPEIGTVGLSEMGARERFTTVDIYKTSFRPLKATITGGAERVVMKLVVDGDTDRVLGAHILGTDAGEIIQALGDRDQDGRDQGRSRRHHAGASDHRRGTGDDARTHGAA